MLRTLKERFSNWTPYLNIGDIFLNQSNHFSSYIEYVSNYNQSLQTYEKLSQNSSFTELMQQAKANSKNAVLDLYDLVTIQKKQTNLF